MLETETAPDPALKELPFFWEAVVITTGHCQVSASKKGKCAGARGTQGTPGAGCSPRQVSVALFQSLWMK